MTDNMEASRGGGLEQTTRETHTDITAEETSPKASADCEMEQEEADIVQASMCEEPAQALQPSGTAYHETPNWCTAAEYAQQSFRKSMASRPALSQARHLRTVLGS